jgi:CheY-like chemotaxis protein
MGQTILVVEDDEALRQALRQALETAGYTVREAATGEEGIETIKKTMPDLILLDLLMPRMSGQDMMHAVEELPGGIHIPVIILTNVPMGETEIQQISRNRPTWYFVKSDWPLAEIVKKVDVLLSNNS